MEVALGGSVADFKVLNVVLAVEGITPLVAVPIFWPAHWKHPLSYMMISEDVPLEGP